MSRQQNQLLKPTSRCADLMTETPIQQIVRERIQLAELEAQVERLRHRHAVLRQLLVAPSTMTVAEEEQEEGE